MRFLVIGLGSMGKRRIRDLKKLGYTDIIGFDTDWDVEIEGMTVCHSNYGWEGLGGVIISTPPDHHNEYIQLAIENRVAAFVEQSATFSYPIIPKGSYIVPSCTMLFHPEIQKLRWKKIINFSYHVGQYLPDWHGGRFYGYYNRSSACRELVAYELNWITSLLGFPNHAFGGCGRTSGFDIYDSYSFSMNFNHCVGSMTVDVVSRKKIRHLIINTEDEQIVLDLKIPESIYIKELKAFIDGVFPNTFEKDNKILKLIERIENGQTME